jgi:hypothetical protein
MGVAGKDQAPYLPCPGKPDRKEGDRLRATGRFDPNAPSFARLGAEGAGIEKITEAKKEERWPRSLRAIRGCLTSLLRHELGAVDPA